MAPRIEISPDQVRAMGVTTKTVVADKYLRTAKRRMAHAETHESAARLHGFATKNALGSLVSCWISNTSWDVVTIESVGEKLKDTADSIEGGDARGEDEFRQQRPVAVSHRPYREMP